MFGFLKKREIKKNKVKCTCGCEKFFEGPSGGCVKNVKCVECGKEFNLIMGTLNPI